MIIRFEGKALELRAGETVLDGLERHGARVPSLCRKGVCQACVLKATRGALPALSQKGLKDSLRVQSFFLSCVCTPGEELDVERAEAAALFSTHVESLELIGPGVLRVGLALPPGFEHEAGQFVQLERPSDGLMRPYSIASLPGVGVSRLELHVALLSGGAMSGWLQTALGASVAVRGPFGGCFYVPGELDRPLLLAGTGTGLAPLLGVVRAALRAGHRGPIHLYHGAANAAGLYLWDELRALLVEAPQLRLTGSVLDGRESASSGSPMLAGCRLFAAPLDQVVLDDRVPMADCRVYLCGHPELVRKLEKKLYLAGAALARIHADPFLPPLARAS